MFLKKDTAVSVKLGAFVDKDDGVTPLTGLTPVVRISKAGGAFAPRNSASAVTHDENGFYTVPLSSTDTNTLGNLVLAVSDAATHLPVWLNVQVMTETDIDVLVSSRLATAGYTEPPTEAEISAEVWAEDVRTLTSFGSLVASIWAYVTRTLTSGGGGATAAEIWAFSERRLTSGVAPSVSSIDPSNYDTTIVRGDDYVNVPLEFTEMDDPGVATIIFKIGDPGKPALFTVTDCSYADTVISVELAKEITVELNRPNYTYTLEIDDGGDIRTVALGRLIVRGKVFDES